MFVGVLERAFKMSVDYFRLLLEWILAVFLCFLVKIRKKQTDIYIESTFLIYYYLLQTLILTTVVIRCEAY
jgi:cellulose synthase/poly-beta-1,6-N-acetylglucosamine synthase-like glycosyltransferase